MRRHFGARQLSESGSLLSTLVEASVALLSSPDLNAVLERILDLAERLCAADAYAIWRFHASTSTWKMPASRGLSRQYTSESSFTYSGPPLDLEPVVISDVSKHPLVTFRLENYRREGIRSMLAIPMSIRGENAGTMTFYFRRLHAFSNGEIELAKQAARMAAAALEMAELHDEQRRLRAEAELAQRRAAFLAEAGAMLASSPKYREVLAQLARLMVPQFADWCVVDILEEDGELTQLELVHADPEKQNLARNLRRLYPPSPDSSGLHAVLQSGTTRFYPEISDSLLTASARDERHLELLRRLEPRSAVLVPLISRGRTFGVITLVSAESGRGFTQADVSFAEMLAFRISAAIENAQLYDQARHNAAARASAEQAMRLALDAANAWSWELDLQTGRFRRSRPVEGIYGAPEGGLDTIHGVLERVHPEDQARVRKVLSDHLDESEREVEYRVVHPDGSIRWLWARGRRMLQPDGRYRIVGVSMDITERRHSEEAMRTAEQLATVGRMAATVAHEINNPLEAITNLLYLAAVDPQLRPETREYLEYADRELRRVSQIARQTLGFYRELAAPVPLLLSDVIDDVLSLLEKKLAGKGLRIVRRYRASEAIKARHGEIRQVISNLIANAIDASPAGGSITVSVSSAREWTAGTRGIRVSIADRGSGISPQHRSRIFDPFFTTKEQLGTGLGLWVTRQIVNGHGGHIAFRSSQHAERHGTVFSVFLPMKPAAEEAESNAAAM